MKKKICVISTIIILVILIFLIFFISRNHFSLSIDGNKIDKEEFLDAALLRRYDVTGYFTQKGGGTVDAGFWERESAGEIPYRKLTEETLEELKYFYAVYGLAKEKGYVQDSSYTAFLERWEAENTSRKEKIAKGEPVYGLAEYTKELYREYEMDMIQKSYCENPDNEGMEISDEERKEYYAAHADAYRQEDDRVLDYVKIPYEQEGMGEAEVKEHKETLTKIYKQTDKEHSLAQLAKKEESVAGYLEHADVTASDLKMYSRSISDILEYAWDLSAGESTAVLDENGCLYLIACTKRSPNDTVTVDDVADHIDKELRESNYDRIIEERAANAVVDGDMEQLYSFMKQHVNDGM